MDPIDVAGWWSAPVLMARCGEEASPGRARRREVDLVVLPTAEAIGVLAGTGKGHQRRPARDVLNQLAQHRPSPWRRGRRRSGPHSPPSRLRPCAASPAV